MASRSAAAETSAAAGKSTGKPTTAAGKSAATPAAAPRKTTPTAARKDHSPATPAPASAIGNNDDQKYNDDDCPKELLTFFMVIDKNVILRPTCALVFPLYRRQNRLHARRATAVKIVVMEPWRDLLVNDPFAQGIRQNPLQSVPHFQKHRVVLDKNKKDCAIIFFFLSHLPGASHANSVILDGRIGLHLWIDGHEDLVGALPLKIFERAVKL